MKKFPLLGLLSIVLYSGPAWGQAGKPEKSVQPADIVTIVATPQEKILIRKLLDVLPETPGGTAQLGGIFDETLKLYRAKYTNVPEKVWTEITMRLKRDFGADKLVDLLTPAYLNSFSAQEIRDLTAFFNSRTGRKWARLMPEIQKASYNAGDAFGYLMGEQINKRLFALGYATPTKQ